MPDDVQWHSLKPSEIYKKLQTSPVGLSETQATERLEKYGKNTIEIERKISLLEIFLGQFKNLPVLLLIAAAIVSLAIGVLNSEVDSLFDAALIFAIVIANAIFGFVQEYKAEESIQALKKMSVAVATVIRNGKEKEIPATEIVPGDMLLLHEGDIIAADARIIEEYSFAADESILTGESKPSSKNIGEYRENISLADRKNTVYMNTNAVRGKAKAIVVGTGLNTEIGKIAKEISEAEEKITQFQVETEDLGQKIAYAVFMVMIIVALTEFFLREGDIITIVLVSISLGVAAIPEGLPAVVTLSLSIGANKMVKQNALMRKLSTIENFSAIDVICTDKTGTITENTMTVTAIYYDGRNFSVTGKGREIKGEFIGNEGGSTGGKKSFGSSMEIILRCAALCNDSKMDSEIGKFTGDPTEIAVLIPSYKAGYDGRAMAEKYARINEIPFSSDSKRMTTINKVSNGFCAHMKGAPEIVVGRCTEIFENGKTRKMTEQDRERIINETEKMGSKALRVLSFAYRELASAGTNYTKKLDEGKIERDFIFLGLMGMIDPPREGVREAISDCKKAGIRVVMITGDNRLTAGAIAGDVGIDNSKTITGEELDSMDNKKLAKVVEEISVYARTSPIHKVKILKALQANQHVVAMTGDGVNDAAAIKNADVGIAMGIRGSEVTKGASDMILLDDNFVTIRNAIAEGRGIYDNIRKFVVYLLGANLAEVLVVFLAAILGWGIALTAVQLLWINLLTDGLPALALGVDPPAKGIMTAKPRKKDEKIIDTNAAYFVLVLGLSATISYMGLFYAYIDNIVKAQTILFTAFVIFEMAKVYLVRMQYHEEQGKNKWLHISVAISIALQLLVLFTPLGAYFKLAPIGIEDIDGIALALIAFVAILLIMTKFEKYVERAFSTGVKNPLTGVRQ